MVERLNRTLCESLAKVKGTDEWDQHIPAVLLAYRTKRHATTGYTPFQLVYGRQATLPIETILPVEPIEEEEIDLSDSILQRAYELIEKLPLYHYNAKDNIEKS